MLFFLDILWQFRRWKGIWSIFISIYFLEGNVENNSVRWRGCFIIAGDFLLFLDNFWELKSVESNYDGYYDWNWVDRFYCDCQLNKYCFVNYARYSYGHWIWYFYVTCKILHNQSYWQISDLHSAKKYPKYLYYWI